MTNKQIAFSLTSILNKEIGGLIFEYSPEEDLTDAELNINGDINIQFCQDGSFLFGVWNKEDQSLTHIVKTYQRYDLVDFVKGFLVKENNLEVKKTNDFTV